MSDIEFTKNEDFNYIGQVEVDDEKTLILATANNYLDRDIELIITPKVTPEKIGAVPSSRTINQKSLDNDVVLTAENVGALPISGGILTGPLSILNGNLEVSSGNINLFGNQGYIGSATNNLVISQHNAKDSNSDANEIILTKPSTDGVESRALKLATVRSGVTKYYALYGEHNVQISNIDISEDSALESGKIYIVYEE